MGSEFFFEERAMRIMTCILSGLLLAAPVFAQGAVQRSKPGSELTAMLNQFMQDASSNNAAGFDRFFADEVIYTGSNGLVRNKADIMRSVNARKTSTTNAAKETYSAENIVVHDFGGTAILAFQLAARTQHADGKTEIANYRDTGTFLRRNGHWQVIAWQATKMPETAPAK
jgi:ketosteroid isomerase-like protein